MDILDDIGHMAQSAACKLHVKSALNPMLWLSAITVPLLLTFAYCFRDIKQIMFLLVIMALVPVGFTCLGFVYFALFKPEKLQSEDYQIRHESLQIIQQKSGQKIFPSATIEAIANPDRPRLISGVDNA
ncbi:MAG: hypothetical protein LLF92_00905 [Planctomycetaceae bacterium]|nr:hypothetical protein [Planctomycetaceae bacterium]